MGDLFWKRNKKKRGDETNQGMRDGMGFDIFLFFII